MSSEGPTEEEARQALVALLGRLAKAGEDLARVNTSLYGRNADNVNQNLQRLDDSARSLAEMMRSFLREGTDQAEDAGPFHLAITPEDRAEMERLKPTLEEYADAHQLANAYAASDLYQSMLEK